MPKPIIAHPKAMLAGPCLITSHADGSCTIRPLQIVACDGWKSPWLQPRSSRHKYGEVIQ